MLENPLCLTELLVKKSIVHDLPGVTRDFVYGETEWDGVSFTVIDTCGIFENAQSYIEENKITYFSK